MNYNYYFIDENFYLKKKKIIENMTNNNLYVFVYWDKGYEFMPDMIKCIYNHNKSICKKYKIDLILLNDVNITNYIKPHRFHKLAPNFKKLIRYYILNKYGGFGSIRCYYFKRFKYN